MFQMSVFLKDTLLTM